MPVSFFVHYISWEQSRLTWLNLWKFMLFPFTFSTQLLLTSSIFPPFSRYMHLLHIPANSLIEFIFSYGVNCVQSLSNICRVFKTWELYEACNEQQGPIQILWLSGYLQSITINYKQTYVQGCSKIWFGPETHFCSWLSLSL